MPSTVHRRFLSALALPLLVTVLGSAPSARAATHTWTGFAFSWQLPQNWTSGVIPVSGDSLYFAGEPTTLTAKNDAPDLALTIQDMTFGSGTGNYVVTGSSIRLNGGMTSTRLGGATVQNNITIADFSSSHTWNVGAGSNLVVTGNISSHGITLLKVGTGTLTLTGNNNYTRSNGTTSIQEGTVVMGSQSALGDIGNVFTTDETVTIGAAGTLNLNGFLVNAANIAPSSTGTIANGSVFSNTGQNVINSTLAGSASLQVNTSSTVTINSANSYTGTTFLNSGLLIINNANGLSSNSTIRFDNATLAFAQSATVNASKFTLLRSSSAYRVETGNGQTVTLTGNIIDPGFIGFQSNFYKSGAGTLALTGVSSDLDNFWATSGTVRFSSINNLVNNTGVIRLSSGATLQWATGSTADISARLASEAGGILDTNGNNVTFATVLTSGGITKTGAGTLTLTAQNTYTGGTVVNGGTLKLNAGGTIGTIRGALTINTGATVESAVTNAFGFLDGLKVDSVTINGGTLNHTAAADCGWGVAYTLSSGALMTSNGGVSNANAATQFSFGGGAGSNTSVNATSGTSTIAGHVDLRGDNGNTNVNFTVATGATLNITAGISSHAPDSSTVGPVGFTKLGGGTLVLTGVNTYSGTTAVNGGVIDFNNASAFGNGGTIAVNTGTLRWTGNTADLSSRLSLGAGGGTFDADGNNVTFASAITGGGGLIKAGAGMLTLGGTNTYTGGTVVNSGTLKLTTGGPAGAIRGALAIGSGATVEIAAVNALGWGDGGVKVDSITINGGTLNNTSAGSDGWGIAYTLSNGALLTSNGGVSSATAASHFAFGGPSGGNTSVNVTSGTNTIAGRVDLRGDNGNTNVNFTVASGAALNVTAGISSWPGVGLTKLGGGLMTLSGANTYSGSTIIQGGLMEFSALNNFGTGNVTLNGGGLRWATGNTADISGRLNALGASGGVFDTNANNVTLASAMSGSGALTKNGAGTLRLTAANTYTGGTVINSGSLTVAQNNALGTGSVRVQGGTLDVEDGRAFSNDVVLSGGTYRRTVTGDLTRKVDATSDLAGGIDTTAKILAGSLGSTSTLVTSFSTTSAALNDSARESDVYHFVGTGTSAFVLELSLTSLEAGSKIGWLSNGIWVDAISGNSGNTATLAMQNFDGSYSEFLTAFGGVSLAQSIGAYGYDAETHSAWAVLNHNSDFAVIPEPGTVGLLVLGGVACLTGRRRRRIAAE